MGKSFQENNVLVLDATIPSDMQVTVISLDPKKDQIVGYVNEFLERIRNLQKLTPIDDYSLYL
jgi:hypothetical protein